MCRNHIQLRELESELTFYKELRDQVQRVGQLELELQQARLEYVESQRYHRYIFANQVPREAPEIRLLELRLARERALLRNIERRLGEVLDNRLTPVRRIQP